jgi:hypothetical protein
MKFLKDPKIDPELYDKEQKYAKDEIETERINNFRKYRKCIVKGKKLIKMNINTGDKVFIFKEIGMDKLQAHWVGGYVVNKVLDPDTYLVSNGMHEIRVNKCRFKRDFSKGTKEVS